MVDLFDYEDGEGPTTYDEPPLVYLNEYTTTLRVPGDTGKLAGYTGIDPNRGKVYLSIRRRREHLYRNAGGYAISDKILAKVQYHEAETVLIWEADNKTTWVFQLKKYLRGDEVPNRFTPTDDTQMVVSLGESINRFEQKSLPIVDQRRK